MVVGRVISGGQTGADLGALQAAARLGIATGGTAPKGYMTERGPRPELLARFGLAEHESALPQDRTAANVRDADLTLILGATLDPGSALTVKLCESHGRPFRVFAALADDAVEAAALWMAAERRRAGRPLTLNVAGNRESSEPGIGAWAEDFVARLLSRIAPPLSRS